MRPVVQAALAVAVVVGSAAAAWAITGSVAVFRDVPKMNVTHTWSIQGEGKGKTQFAIDSGSVYFGPDSASLSCDIRRTRPAGMVSGGYAYLTIPKKSATNTVYRAGANSGAKGLTGEQALQLLADQGFLIGPVSRAEDTVETSKYHPIAGNVTTTWAASSLNGRVYSNFTRYNVDATTSYRGTIAGGPNDGRNVRGTIRVTGRKLPRGSM